MPPRRVSLPNVFGRSRADSEQQAMNAWRIRELYHPDVRRIVDDYHIGRITARERDRAVNDLRSAFIAEWIQQAEYTRNPSVFDPRRDADPRVEAYKRLVPYVKLRVMPEVLRKKQLSAERRMSQLTGECPICTDPYERQRIGIRPRLAEDPVELEPCGHIFHKKCIDRSMSTATGRGKCPSCRGQVTGRGSYKLSPYGNVGLTKPYGRSGVSDPSRYLMFREMGVSQRKPYFRAPEELSDREVKNYIRSLDPIIGHLPQYIHRWPADRSRAPRDELFVIDDGVPQPAWLLTQREVD